MVASLATAAIVALVASRLFGTNRRSPRAAESAVGRTSRSGSTWASITRSRGRLRRRRVDPAHVAAWCDDLARTLRHGSALRASLMATIPSDETVEAHAALLRHRLDRGASVHDACDAWADDLTDSNFVGVEVLTTFAAVVSAAATLGGGAAAPIDRFAVTMRTRASDDLERGAQSAQARMSAHVMTVVPLAVLALLLLTDGDVRHVVAGPTGATVVVIGLALNGIGGSWMRRIVGPAARPGRP